MKTLLALDSFKGCLTAPEAVDAAAAALAGRDVCRMPLSDGGEGFAECLAGCLGGVFRTAPAHDPLGRPVEARYALLDGGRTAVIETAAASGLTLLKPEELDPLTASSIGTGELMQDAVKQGVEEIWIGLGGTAVMDCGAGLLQALAPLPDHLRIHAFYDVDIPLTGPAGAPAVFGPQKGADPDMVKALDAGLRHLGEVIKRDLGRDLTQVPGGGAAGAMGVGMMAFFDSTLQMGIETVLNTVAFDSLISDADVIFTGEGKIDSQSLRGKVVIGVARRAKKQAKPVIAVVGGSDLGMEPAYEEGVKAIFTINRLPQDLSVSKAFSRENLAFAMDNILRMM